MNLIKGWLSRFSEQNPLLLPLLILSAAFFLFYYITDPVRPAYVFTSWFGFHDQTLYGKGWFGHIDQGAYLNLAHTLADFDFRQLHTTFLYGLGYPLVAVPFIWLGFDTDPFVFFNLFAFVFAVYATYRLTMHFISPVAGFLAGFGLAFATPLITYTDQPWNSTVCLVAVSGILLVATAKKVNRWHFLLLGLLVGWSFAARYVDAIFLTILAVTSLYRGSLKTLAKQIAYFIIGTCIVVLPVLYVQNRIFGSPFKTPYVLHIMHGESSSDQKPSSYSLRKIPETFTAIFIGPKFVDNHGKSNVQDTSRGMLVYMFWTITAIPGAYLLLRNKQTRLFGLGLTGFTVLVTLFYLSFRGTDIDAVKYELLHYFKMLWPGVVVMTAVFIEHLLTRFKTVARAVDHT